jgi:hypothetical protein
MVCADRVAPWPVTKTKLWASL